MRGSSSSHSASKRSTSSRNTPVTYSRACSEVALKHSKGMEGMNHPKKGVMGDRLEYRSLVVNEGYMNINSVNNY